LAKKEPKTINEFLIIEPIIGYREWMYSHDKDHQLKLVGTGSGNNCFWEPGINIAKCLYKCKKAPNFKCSCGFYALKYKVDLFKELFLPSPTQFYASAGYSVGYNNDDYSIYGEVELTGKVIEHRDGYRAEKAEIKKLIYIDMDKIKLEFLTKYYKVPIVYYKDYFEMVFKK